MATAETVNGSKIFAKLEAGPGRILVDCGLFQGLKGSAAEELAAAAVSPVPSVDRAHYAHITDARYSSRFVHDGFSGPVYCTPTTAKLAELMLFTISKE